jgi:hypothetical protein
VLAPNATLQFRRLREICEIRDVLHHAAFADIFGRGVDGGQQDDPGPGPGESFRDVDCVSEMTVLKRIHGAGVNQTIRSSARTPEGKSLLYGAGGYRPQFARRQ